MFCILIYRFYVFEGKITYSACYHGISYNFARKYLSTVFDINNFQAKKIAKITFAKIIFAERKAKIIFAKIIFVLKVIDFLMRFYCH